MRPLLLVLALCAAGAAAQVSYAPRAGQGASGRRRRLRPRRPVRPEPQQADGQTLVPFLPSGASPPSRERFQPLSAPQQDFRPQQDFQQDFQQGFQQDFRQGFRPQQDFRQEFQQPRPAPTTLKPRPSPRPTAQPSIQPSRASSRFQPQQIDFADYAPETDSKSELESEDYEDEPDRLTVLLETSSFRCEPADTGYFADDSVNCEVFHYCAAGVKHSWVCPDGNIFHQINLICQPKGSDNICQRSGEFHFVNDYLYQQINNDTLRPQYADRYYPDSAAGADQYADRPAPQASYNERQPEGTPERRRRPRPPQRFGPSGNGFSDGFRQGQSQSVLRPTQQARQRAPVEDFDPAAFHARARVPAPQQAELASTFGQDSFQRRGDEARPLPPVRPPGDPYPSVALRPDITFRGAPQPAQERRDQIVLGGFQGNVDIEDLASRRAGQ
ncbi:uncharacterized protein LOC119108642 [Pollicipes pollicipes]|uniref:uncharacterized protein LOC119108642 n=1 Tax=Pollicipes pollicipes TaxID=41117 RepID=UPI001884B98C|nr:uncharacterized protein LOC119108642 [Pollicipes pollicipes]